ncbi:Protein of unknown function (DUF2771) [Streptoalloteichus tenebrarius]|uniref:Lipoprotein n=1 Tax=Streptoalloteichus tenebrarius (strain ATCC 17920 / DSM 40477 / JCM 4838 / CBS 697.72 / NBRC 16177 / NCIMB 11028 / NRRL B-12390 / A12253. 1 / ISP 5477) TaxID=1933 RepID=A0ABT1HVJ8_STRSD|nr:Protein of unknown function (DUF2771) [Streptoalloteichus tenebrarius]BFF01398.1 DUF2771 family protein [Streptoalloteichus tenebrarius]
MLAAAGLAVAGCSAPPKPEVTFYAAGHSVAVRPTQHCDENVENCSADPDAAAVLRVPAGRPLQISVDDGVAATPWQVVFRYRVPGGERVDGRSEVFAPDKQFAYTLRLPEEGAQLETVEVHQFGAVLFQRVDGGIDFPTRATWVLSVDDRDDRG